MKKISLIVLSLMLSLIAFAENAVDVIITVDEKKIEAKILEVSKSEIHYKQANYLDGPTFVLSTSEISSILYGNGTVTVFRKAGANEGAEAATQDKSTARKPSKKKNIYQNYTELGGFMNGKKINGKTLPTGGIEGVDIYGCRFNEYAFLGAGIGLSGLFYKDDGAYYGKLQLPIFADLRTYIPTKKVGLYPYFAVSLGPQIQYYEFGEGQTSSKINLHAYFRAYTGVEYRRFTFGVGYMLWGEPKSQRHYGFVKVGLRLSRRSIY